MLVKNTNQSNLFSNHANKTDKQTKKILRSLELDREHEIMSFSEYGMEIKVYIPINYLLTSYNANISNYGIVLYNKYPLTSPNSVNFTEKVLSLKLYDNNLKEITCRNLSKPIYIFIKKTAKMSAFSSCIYFDDKITTWNTNGCETSIIADNIICSCNHLTDFSLAKYSPLRLGNDVINTLFDAWIINDTSTFTRLNFKSAYMVYIFLAILLSYLIALRFSIKKDMQGNKDFYIYEIEADPAFCSNEEVLIFIKSLYASVQEDENKRIEIALKFIQFQIGTLVPNIADKDKNDNNFNFDIITAYQAKQEDCKHKSIKQPIEKIKNNNKTSTKANALILKEEFYEIELGNISSEKPENNLQQSSVRSCCKPNSIGNSINNNDNNRLKLELNIGLKNEEGIIHYKNKNSIKAGHQPMPDISAENISKKKFEELLNIYSTCEIIDGIKIRIKNQEIHFTQYLQDLYSFGIEETRREIQKFFELVTSDENEKLKTSKAFNKSKSDLLAQESTASEVNVGGLFFNNSNNNNSRTDSINNKNGIQPSNSNQNKNKRGIFNKNFDSLFRSSSTEIIDPKNYNFNYNDVVVKDNYKYSSRIHFILKNNQLKKYIKLLFYFFKNNFSLLCLIIESDIPFTQSSFVTIFFSRLIAKLAVGTMLTLRIDPNRNKSSKVTN